MLLHVVENQCSMIVNNTLAACKWPFGLLVGLGDKGFLFD